MLRDGRWPAMGPPFLPSLCDAGLPNTDGIEFLQGADQVE